MIVLENMKISPIHHCSILLYKTAYFYSAFPFPLPLPFCNFCNVWLNFFAAKTDIQCTFTDTQTDIHTHTYTHIHFHSWNGGLMEWKGLVVNI